MTVQLFIAICIVFVTVGILANKYKIARYIFYTMLAALVVYVLIGITYAWIINPTTSFIEWLRK